MDRRIILTGATVALALALMSTPEKNNSRTICGSKSLDDVVSMVSQVPANKRGVHIFTNPFLKISYEATIENGILAFERVVDPLAVSFGLSPSTLGAQTFFVDLETNEIKYLNPTSGTINSDIIGNYSLCVRLNEFKRLMYEDMTF